MGKHFAAIFKRAEGFLHSFFECGYRDRKPGMIKRPQPEGSHSGVVIVFRGAPFHSHIDYEGYSHCPEGFIVFLVGCRSNKKVVSNR